MDTTELDAAYRGLLAAATSITDTGVLPQKARTAIDWTLSHIALSDRLLAATARDVLTGPVPVVDNRAAMDDDAITAVIASTTHLERVELVRRNADDLVAALEAITEHAAATPVLLRLVDRDGRPLPEQRLPWREVVRLRVTEHIPGHTARIAALVSTG